MLFMPYDIESQSCNADFISIAAERQSATFSPSGLSPPERSEHNLSTQPAAEPRPFLKICGVSRYHHPLNHLKLLNPLNPHARRACPWPKAPSTFPSETSDISPKEEYNVTIHP